MAISFNAFLSHKYKEPGPLVNEFFFKLFSEVAEVQFEVDLPADPLVKTDLSVTRLERLIRDSEAFVGIYPYKDLAEWNPSIEKIRDASKYFRLEIDLAARARKPALIFADSRFRNEICAPSPMTQVAFDIRELASDGDKPSAAKFKKAFGVFCECVRSAREYRLSENSGDFTGQKVGILLPPSEAEKETGYSRDQMDIVAAKVSAEGYELVPLSWPPLVTPRWLASVRSLDWIVIDVGAATSASGIVGFLHGAFLPALRLSRISSQAGPDGASAPALFGGIEVGYNKDIVRWWDSDSLANGLSERLASLRLGRRRISTVQQAIDYFLEAAKLQETVFISYSGKDEEVARDICQAFRDRFQQVFDYKDGTSIRSGQPWNDEVFNNLSKSSIAVPLYSASYFLSGNCAHELRDIVAGTDSGKMRMIPIKLRDEAVTIPQAAESIQYERLWQNKSAAAVVEKIIGNLKKPSAT